MSHTNPYKDFTTLTGEISHQLDFVIDLMKQHSILHLGKHKLYAKRINRIKRAWDMLPYPHEVENKNKSFV